MNETLRAKVRARIVELVPEIMEINFGCQLERRHPNDDSGYYSIYWVLTTVGHGRTDNCVWISSLPFGAMTLDWSKDELEKGGQFKNIGRPITLADVLLALPGRKGELYSVSQEGEIYKTHHDLTCKSQCKWDLRHDLDGQPEEVWEWLADALGVAK